MPNILYKATNSQGAEVAGFVEADTADAAVARLKAKGLTGIELHESPGNAMRRSGREGLSEAASAQLAAFELQVRRKPGLRTLLGEVERRNRWWIGLCVGLIAGGLATGHSWLASAGAVMVAITFGVPAWNHRFSRYFNRMLQSMAVGDWDEAARMLKRFRQKQHVEQIAVSIEFYDAQIRVRQGEPLQQVLARLEPCRARLAKSPSHFAARVASVHAAAKDYSGFLDNMRAAFEAAPEDPSRRVDYALAHARLGDLQMAEQLLAGIDMEALQVQGRPYVDWARGLIALRQDRPGAQEALTNGVAAFLKIATPAAWSSLALCSGACALAMHRDGDTAGAKKMLARVWTILIAHWDPRLMNEIKSEIGEPA